VSKKSLRGTVLIAPQLGAVRWRISQQKAKRLYTTTWKMQSVLAHLVERAWRSGRRLFAGGVSHLFFVVVMGMLAIFVDEIYAHKATNREAISAAYSLGIWVNLCVMIAAQYPFIWLNKVRAQKKAVALHQNEKALELRQNNLNVVSDAEAAVQSREWNNCISRALKCIVDCYCCCPLPSTFKDVPHSQDIKQHRTCPPSVGEI